MEGLGLTAEVCKQPKFERAEHCGDRKGTVDKPLLRNSVDGAANLEYELTVVNELAAELVQILCELLDLGGWFRVERDRTAQGPLLFER